MCNKNKYLISGRLADIITLIQVLGYSTFTHRSENHIQEQFQVQPKSSSTWLNIVHEHPEFFRYNKNNQFPISLTVKFLIGEENHPLSDERINELIKLAIELFEVEKQKSENMKFYVSFILTFIISISGTILTFCLKQS